MTHEGRMARGKEKLSKELTDEETEYYLANKPVEKEVLSEEDPGHKDNSKKKGAPKNATSTK